MHWPKVRDTDRCGDGEPLGDGTGPGVVTCRACFHWLQPNDQPVEPDYRKGLPVEWWAASGYCTRHAPSPSAEDDRKVYWRVTHADDGCGDGDQVKTEADDEPAKLASVCLA